MNRMMLAPASMLLLAALGGCTGESEESATEPTPADASPIEAQRQALERARGVEENLAEAAERQRETIDESGG